MNKTIKGKIMKLGMFPMIGEQFQIFWSIIVFYAILMVNSLFWRQMSSNYFFHYETVFGDVSMFISKGMSFLQNTNISIFVFIFSPLPSIILFSSCLSFFKFSSREKMFSWFDMATYFSKFRVFPLVGLRNFCLPFFRKMPSLKSLRNCSYNTSLFNTVVNSRFWNSCYFGYFRKRFPAFIKIDNILHEYILPVQGGIFNG